MTWKLWQDDWIGREKEGKKWMKIAGRWSALGDGSNHVERCPGESNIVLTKLKSVSTTSARNYEAIMGMMLTLLNGHTLLGYVQEMNCEGTWLYIPRYLSNILLVGHISGLFRSKKWLSYLDFGSPFLCSFIFLSWPFYVEIIVDSHAVGGSNLERSHVAQLPRVTQW